MPQKRKTYDRVIFTPEVIREAVNELTKSLAEEQRKLTFRHMKITVSPEEAWSHDTEEEFFADYRKGFQSASFRKEFAYGEGKIHVWVYGDHTQVEIKMPSRADAERIFDIFEANAAKCQLPTPPPIERVKPRVKVFIGHGRDPQWRDLKDHLHEKHGLDVEAYEIGARAGLTIKEVLDDMLASSSFALLVMTGEDLDITGGLHPRENVIHELGLFQGYLGWERAIVLLEEGVEEFSNIHGLNQIRFSSGNIQETFGEVLATIRREFGSDLGS
jgi:predicted nucleotide-binding protein